MTHGEAWFRKKEREDKNESLKTTYPYDEGSLPPRMGDKEASRYYNKKLFDYFSKSLEFDNNKDFTKEITSFLMFRDKDYYKKLELK